MNEEEFTDFEKDSLIDCMIDTEDEKEHESAVYLTYQEQRDITHCIEEEITTFKEMREDLTLTEEELEFVIDRQKVITLLKDKMIANM